MGTQTLRCTDYSRAGSWHVAAKLPRLFGNCGLVSTANNRKENFLRSKSNKTNMVFGQFQRFTIFYLFIFFQIYCWHLLVFLVRCAMNQTNIRLDCIYKKLLVRLRLWRFGLSTYCPKEKGKYFKELLYLLIMTYDELLRGVFSKLIWELLFWIFWNTCEWKNIL